MRIKDFVHLNVVKGSVNSNIMRAKLLDEHPTTVIDIMTSLEKYLRSLNIYTQFISNMKIYNHVSC